MFVELGFFQKELPYTKLLLPSKQKHRSALGVRLPTQTCPVETERNNELKTILPESEKWHRG